MPLIEDPKTIMDLRANGIRVYDYSSIAWSINCPRGFKYRHEMGLTLTSTEINHSLEFGRCIHKTLQFWYPTRKDDEALLMFARDFKPFEEQPTMSPKTGKILDATYTVRFGCSLLDAYFTRYKDESFELIQNEIPVAEELVEGVYVSGRIDKILRQPKGLFFRDHKTSKYMDKYTTNPSPQFMGYKFLTEKLTGQHASGELDMIGVSKTKDLASLLRREPFDYTPYQMSQWKASLVAQIKQLEVYREANFWPQFWNCKPFFRDCMYLPLCTLARGEEHDGLVANLYTTHFWDPFSID